MRTRSLQKGKVNRCTRSPLDLSSIATRGALYRQRHGKLAARSFPAGADIHKRSRFEVKFDFMLALRSLIFSILFYGLFAVCAVAAAGISLISPKSLPPFARWWSHAWLAMYRAVCGVHYEVRGRENIPHGACLLAVKHQSVWDTCALFAIFDRPVFVLKRELMFIPFFGWALARLGCIPIKRGTGKSALDNMVRGTRVALAQNKQVVIFPEGTRTMIGQAANYKTGISHLYTALEVACVPVALNSGALWPRRKFLRPPGTIVVEVLPPIPPGIGRKEMFDLMVAGIEDASVRLSQWHPVP